MIETTSLELSKKLKPILEGKVDNHFIWLEGELYEGEGIIERYKNETSPRYTACELMAFLPEDFLFNDEICQIMMTKNFSKWCVYYSDDGSRAVLDKVFESSNPAEALGEMVVWLHKEGLLK
jgi:hypothetical protein